MPLCPHRRFRTSSTPGNPKTPLFRLAQKQRVSTNLQVLPPPSRCHKTVCLKFFFLPRNLCKQHSPPLYSYISFVVERCWADEYSDLCYRPFKPHLLLFSSLRGMVLPIGFLSFSLVGDVRVPLPPTTRSFDLGLLPLKYFSFNVSPLSYQSVWFFLRWDSFCRCPILASSHSLFPYFSLVSFPGTQVFRGCWCRFQVTRGGSNFFFSRLSSQSPDFF